MIGATNPFSQAANDSNVITMVLISESEWNGLRSEIEQIKSFVSEKELQCKTDDKWLSVPEVLERLHICPKTWQKYKNRKNIPFTQFGRKIYVKESDIEKFMAENHIEARRSNINHGNK